jgi:hypothetical protein
MLKSISQKIRASCFAIISARFLSTRSGNSGVLLREWITDSLYHPQKGYFTKHAQILTPVPQDQDIEIFSSFSSRKDYLRWLKRVFRSALQNHFLTHMSSLVWHYHEISDKI